MKPAVADRQLTTHGAMVRADFGIDLANQAHILRILRDTLYSNKILAVLREYGSNAWDAHIEVGKSDLPIKVVLPTAVDAQLTIRDWGPGLSEDGILNTFVKYGASTKRETNNAVGMLGIGAKSAFAYSDAFTITSWHGGMKSIWTCALDETDVGVIQKLYEEPCAVEETGIKIRVPVNPSDIAEFQREAAVLYPFFDPQPDVNLAIEKPAEDRRKSGFLRKHQIQGLPNWVAIMGCVPYTLDFRQLEEQLEADGLTATAKSLYGGLYLDIGDVDIAASREALQYTERTKLAVLAKLRELNDEVAEELIAIIEKPGDTTWQRRLRAREFLRTTGIALPKEYAKFGKAHITLYRTESTTGPNNVIIPATTPKTFKLHKLIRDYVQERNKRGKLRYQYKHVLKDDRSVLVDKGSRIIIRDTDKPMSGYERLHSRDNFRFASPVGGAGAAEIFVELTALLEANDSDGIKVSYLSGEVFTEPEKVEKNRKHTRKYFVLSKDYRGSDRYRYYEKWSDKWDWIDKPKKEEEFVYVVLSRFEPTGSERNFFRTYYEDQELLKSFFGMTDEDLPVIHGIKTTETKPVVRDEIKNGTPYYTWLQRVMAAHIDEHPHLAEWIQLRHWTKAHPWGSEKIPGGIRKMLGQGHPICRYFRERMESKAAWTALGESKSTPGKDLSEFEEFVQTLARHSPKQVDEEGKEILPIPTLQHQGFLAKYPLLDNNVSGMNGLERIYYKNSRKALCDYINLIDSKDADSDYIDNYTTAIPGDPDDCDSGPTGDDVLDQEGGPELRGSEEVHPAGGVEQDSDAGLEGTGD